MKARDKYVCPRCGAVHWYRPLTGCQACGAIVFLQKVERGIKVADQDELRLTIDPLRLDYELTGQPQMVYVWAKKVADCQAEYDNAKSNLTIQEAEFGRDLRANPDAFGLDRTTDKAIEAAIVCQPEYKAAVRKVNRARHDLDVAKAALEALQHRKRSLTLLVELWVRDYYSDATVHPRSEKGENYIDQATKADVRSRGRERMKREEDKERDDDDES